MQERRPKVGVGVFVIRDGKFLMQKRKGAHGSGCWSLPGGHLEFGESIEDCAKREVLEETGLEIVDIKLGPFTNDIFLSDDKHYITIFTVCKYQKGEPGVKEPEYCEEVEWFEPVHLPSPLFLPLENLLKTGFNPFLL